MKTSTLTPSAPWSPARALLHPVWLLGLAVLAVNDHVLKQAELLPGALTGKLSDFAGLLIAPLLLAVVVGARSPRAVALCHGAVGAVFAALQLVPEVAGLWDSAWTAVGIPWRTWSDPTDLVALPMLGVSWLLFAPQATWARQRRPWAEAAVASVGMIFCMATSPPPCDPSVETCYEEPCEYDESRDVNGNCIRTLNASVYAHNSTPWELKLVVRPLRGSIGLNCEAIAADPAALVTEALFTPGQTWTVPPHTSIPIEPTSYYGCNLALIEGDNLPRALVYWNSNDFPPKTLLAEPVADEATLPNGGILVKENEFGTLSLEQQGGGPQLIYKLGRGTDPETVAEECLPTPPEQRLDWSPVATTSPLNFALSELEPGLDGCIGMTLDPGEGGPLQKSRWFICIAPEDFPFQSGDIVSIEATADTVTLRRIGTNDGEQRPYVAFHAWRAVGIDTPLNFGLGFSAEPHATCGPVVNADCGDAAQNQALTFTDVGADTRLTLAPGQRGEIQRFDGSTRELTLLYGATSLVAPFGCSPVSRGVGLQIDLIITEHPTATP